MRKPVSFFTYVLIGIILGLFTFAFFSYIFSIQNLYIKSPIFLGTFAGVISLRYLKLKFYNQLTEEERRSTSKPFSLYTYYLIAILTTFFSNVIITYFWQDINFYTEIMVAALIFIAILFIGHFKWRRYRKLTGARESTAKYGILSTPLGVQIQLLFGNNKNK